jgi:putative transposase
VRSPPKSTARRRIDQWDALDAIIFRLRTGCQWNHLPTEEFPDDSSVHRTFQRWVELGVLERGSGRYRSRSVKNLVESTGSGRRPMGRGSFWGDLLGPNPTDRGKNGVKRSLLVEANGGPLAVVVGGANVREDKLVATTLDAIVVERPKPLPKKLFSTCVWTRATTTSPLGRW